MEKHDNTSAFASEWDDEQLLASYEDASASLAEAQANLGRLEWVILTRIEDRGATSIPSHLYRCEAKNKTEYDQLTLMPLKETILDADLALCFQAAHQKTVDVPDTWNITKLKAVARRYGTTVVSTLEKAKLSRPAGIKFERLMK